MPGITGDWREPPNNTPDRLHAPLSRRLVRWMPLLICVVAGCWAPNRSSAPNELPREKSQQNNAGGESPFSSIRFSNVAEQAQIDFIYRDGQEAGHASILESLGGGAAVVDYDNDGYLDILLTGGGRFGPNEEILGLPAALYRNDGDWRFAQVAPQAGIDAARHYSHGAAVADYDNDGFADVLVTGYGGLTLYRNQGDGAFQEVTNAAQLSDRLWSSSAAWGDLDNDSQLDLFVVHYVNWSFQNHPNCPGPQPGQREVCPPRKFSGLPDALYHNLGDGAFDDVSTAAGLRPDGHGLGVVIADVDLDGDSDVYVANDSVDNFLYVNDGSGRLAEIGLTSGSSGNETGGADGSMGVDVGDYDLDGRPDIWVANFERETFALYRNLGDRLFRHVSRLAGVSSVGGLYVGWGAVFCDFDRDADEDVFVSNGHVVRYPENAPLRQLPLLFVNDNGRRFHNSAETAGDYLAASHMGRGAAVGDIDNDGDIDIVVSHVNEPAAVLSNETPNANHWISVRLIGVRSNRDAIGALVRLKTAARQQTRQRKGGASYASSHDPRLFFGLGAATTVEEIEIRWPSGALQVLRDVAADQTLILHEPQQR